MTNNKPLDGREASKIVKQYFDEVHKPFGPIAFQILKVELDKRKGFWRVECEFFPGIGVNKKARYLLEIDRKSGSIENVILEKETPEHQVKLPGQQ